MMARASNVCEHCAAANLQAGIAETQYRQTMSVQPAPLQRVNIGTCIDRGWRDAVTDAITLACL